MDTLGLGDRTLLRLKDGAFGPHLWCIDTIVERQLGSGYAVNTLLAQVRQLSALGAWLTENGFTKLAEATPPIVQEFVRSQPPRLNRGPVGVFMLPKLVAQVRQLVGIPEPVLQETRLQPITDGFKKYLQEERGLAESTVRSYAEFAHKFLSSRFGLDPAETPVLSELCHADVIRHVISGAQTIGSRRVQFMVGALRVFLNYLFLRGDVKANLASSVLTVANWSLQTLPKALEPEDTRLLLKHCNTRTAVGKRDFAVLLLLARLGLRAGEVVGLTLDAIDWDAGEIILFGKSRRVDRLPMPRDVGEAIVAYLQSARPACSSRLVFVRARAPYVGLSSSCAIGDIVRRGLRRAGLTPARKGAHLLRHGLAQQMLRRGANLTEIGQVLRHQWVNTTAIYAKVDLDALRPLTLSWPGGAR